MKAWDDREWQQTRARIVARGAHRMQAHPMYRASALRGVVENIGIGIACFIGGFVVAAILTGG
jgi:hypothetical protein